MQGMPQQTQPNTVQITDDQIEKALVMEALVSNDVGIAFLQRLCSLCGWSRSMQSDWDAARRDIWLALRLDIPAEKLDLIENVDIRNQQKMIRELMAAAQLVTTPSV